MPVLPSWLTNPLWDQFAALLPDRPAGYHPDHPLGCHRRPVADRVVFDKLIQVLVVGCGYRKIADQTCSATTIRDRRDAASRSSTRSWRWRTQSSPCVVSSAADGPTTAGTSAPSAAPEPTNPRTL